MPDIKEVFLICRCGEVVESSENTDFEWLICKACQRQGCFEYLCEDCKGTEIIDGMVCHCVHD